MATYIPNITDTFPDIQPFKPDYDFLMNALQYKQSQYNAGFSQVNDVYSSILNSDLTRPVNQQRKAEFLKAAEDNIKKISSLDLSLPQNVQLASNVFKPFYEDNNIVKDMTWTKQWSNELQKAQSLKDSSDEKIKATYWDTGVKALLYQKQEFAETDDEKALRAGKATYTPFVDVNKMAFDYIKEAGFEIKTPPNLSGQWLVTHTNGKNAILPMMKYVSLLMANDPKVNDYYKTLEYVQYNDYVNQQAPMLGSKELAQKAYADQILATAPKQYNELVTRVREDYNKSNIRVGANEDLIKSEGIIPGSEEHKNYLESLKERDVLKAAVQTVDSKEQELNGISDYILKARALKRNIDMMNTFSNVANTAAYIKTSTDVTANPYALDDHRALNDMKVAEFKKKLEDDAKIVPGNLLTIPTTPGGDIDLGDAVEVNKNVLTQAKGRNVQQMADFISRVSGVQGTPISFDGKPISAAKLAELSLNPANASKIAKLFDDYSVYVKDGKGKNDASLVNLYRSISETSSVINTAESKFTAGFENAFRSFQSTPQYKEAAGEYFNISNIARNGKPVSKEEYINSYVQKFRQSGQQVPGRPIVFGGSSALSMGSPVNQNVRQQAAFGEAAIRERAANEYNAIMKSVSNFYDKNNVYSAYNDLYASGQVNLGTGQMNVGAVEVVYDPTVNNVVATTQMQSLINSFKRNPNEVLLRLGDASEKGEGAATEKGLKLKNILDNTLLDAVTASKGESRYVTSVQYQRAVAGDSNYASYQINLSQDAITKIKDTDEALYKEIQNSGGKISVQVPKNLDRNPLQAASQTIDPIKARINMSETGSYTFNVPNGGYATMTELQNNVVSISGAYEIYDPKSGNFKRVDVSIPQELVGEGGYTAIYNNLINTFNNYSTQNLRQKKANLAVNGVKDPNALK
jgi:hypothetical protein